MFTCYIVFALLLLLIVLHFLQAVFKSQGFHELSEDALVFILQSDKLQMDEVDILTYVKQWANVNAVSGELIIEL